MKPNHLSIFFFILCSSLCAKAKSLEVKITYYWTAEYLGEQDQQSYTVVDQENNPIAIIPRNYASKLWMEGAGKLPDGRMVNLVDGNKLDNAHFILVDNAKFPWGLNAKGEGLKPLKTIAVDTNVIPAGSKIYIPKFEGFTYQDKIHDGCFIASDTSHSFSGKQIDIFVGHEKDYPIIEKSLDTYNNKVKIELNSSKC